jgi:hypothetical protein
MKEMQASFLFMPRMDVRSKEQGSSNAGLDRQRERIVGVTRMMREAAAGMACGKIRRTLQEPRAGRSG